VFVLLSDIITLVVVGFYFSSSKREKNLLPLFLYLIIGVLSDYIFNPIIKHYSNNYSIGLRIFTFIEFLCISTFYYRVFGEKSKKLLALIVAAFGVFSIIDFYFSRNSLFDSVPTGISSLVFVSYSIIFFYYQLKYNNSTLIYRLFEFWAIVGVFIYFSGNFFLFIFSQKNFSDPLFKNLFYAFMSIFSIMRNLFWLTAIIVSKKRS
jgi:hypothetical protein